MTTPDDAADRVRWVYASQSAAELEARYDAWAASYDHDLTETFDYVLPARCVGEFAGQVDPAAKVLDVGAGTGLVGHYLRGHGFGCLFGIDISIQMLRRAGETGTYRGLVKANLADPLPFPSAAFDAAIGVGVFTEGHAPAAAFPEIVRVVRAGGVVLTPIRTDILDTHGFRSVFRSLTDRGAWAVISVSEPYPAMPRGEPDVLVQTHMWQVR